MEKFETFFEDFVAGNLLPINRRRRILVESQYIFPSSGDKAIMDLYALYALWWEIGGGKEAYNYDDFNIRNHKVRERINRYFEEALVTIANKLLVEAKDAVGDEAEHVYDEILFSDYDGHKPLSEIVIWFKENNLLRKFKQYYDNNGSIKWFDLFNYDQTINMFSAPFWRHANLYGGEKWAAITQAVKELDNAIRREDVTKLMGSFDKLMDLEHNTGNLYSKLNQMKVSKKTLDLRAGFRSVKEFQPYVSDQVSKLINLVR
jgi:hypothetical protein